MLTLIGLGLFDENDLTLKAVEEAKKSDKTYIELYTSKWHGNLENLEMLVGKNITELKRKDLEENSSIIIEEAKSLNIVIFVQGDPAVQTTHSALLDDVKKSGAKTTVIHNASIISAVGETGLHAQKFGRYVSIPFPEKTSGQQPESVFSIIKENRKMGLHTLCLLDVVAEEDRYMTVKEALYILVNGGVVGSKDKIVVFARAGSDDPLVVYDDAEKIMERNIQDIPAVVIVPGKLHFTEEEYLKKPQI